MASRIFLSKVKVAVSLEKDRFRTNTQLDVYKYVFFYPSRFPAWVESFFTYLNANLVKVLEVTTPTHDFCLNLSFSRYNSSIQTRGLTICRWEYEFI